MSDKPMHVKPSFYAVMFEPLKEIALKHGYNLVIHGSLNRDMDLIAIPWEEIATEDVAGMIIEMAEFCGGEVMSERHQDRKRYHGRVTWVINIFRNDDSLGMWKDHQYYLDISVTPKCGSVSV